MFNKTASSISSQYEEMKATKKVVIEILSREGGYWENKTFTPGSGNEPGETRIQKILTKGGAEIIAGLFNLDVQLSTPSYTNVYQDGNVAGMHVIVSAKVLREGKEIAQGAGARSISYDNYALNTSIKMAQKSAYIDAVLRAAQLSSEFMQEAPAKDEKNEGTPNTVVTSNKTPEPKIPDENQEEKTKLIAAIKESANGMHNDLPPMFNKNTLVELTIEQLAEAKAMVESSLSHNTFAEQEQEQEQEQEIAKAPNTDFTGFDFNEEDEEADAFEMV